jgi:hypothetical protein
VYSLAAALSLCLSVCLSVSLRLSLSLVNYALADLGPSFPVLIAGTVVLIVGTVVLVAQLARTLFFYFFGAFFHFFPNVIVRAGTVELIVALLANRRLTAAQHWR